MISPDIKNRIDTAIAQACDASGAHRRRESLRLAEMISRFSARHDCRRKEECDRLLYELTFRKKAGKSADAQKIRFWRTGRYYPRNRAVCEAFAGALSLSPEERLFLIREWYDRCDRAFTRKDTADPEYRRRLSVMDQMKKEFIMKISPGEKEQYGITDVPAENSLRYLYCLKARSYLYPGQENSRVILPGDTASYTSRFTMDMKLLGEISRASMIRHIIILSAPYINSALVSEKLALLGYAPLDKEHLSPDGYARDSLLISLLDLYEAACGRAGPQECSLILQEILSYADQRLKEQGKTGLSVMRHRFLNP